MVAAADTTTLTEVLVPLFFAASKHVITAPYVPATLNVFSTNATIVPLLCCSVAAALTTAPVLSVSAKPHDTTATSSETTETNFTNVPTVAINGDTAPTLGASASVVDVVPAGVVVCVFVVDPVVGVVVVVVVVVVVPVVGV